MIADYTKNPQLFERCINLLNEVFPGCKDFALQGMKYNASWPACSTPFIIEEAGEIIAHAGVWPLTFMLNGKDHHTASIHGVCVKPAFRGKGYFKKLMQETMEYTENNFDSSILFTEKPYLYNNYPYKLMLPEYDFIINETLKFKTTNSDLKVLSLDNTDNFNLVQNLLASRVPLSNQLSVKAENGNALFIFNTLHKSLQYSEKLNAMIIYEIINNTLYIKEIVSPKQHAIDEIIEVIPHHCDKIILQFCPDNFLNEKDYKAVLARPECSMMVSDTFAFTGKYFRYPELYWC